MRVLKKRTAVYMCVFWAMKVEVILAQISRSLIYLLVSRVTVK